MGSKDKKNYRTRPIKWNKKAKLDKKAENQQLKP